MPKSNVFSILIAAKANGWISRMVHRSTNSIHSMTTAHRSRTGDWSIHTILQLVSPMPRKLWFLEARSTCGVSRQTQLSLTAWYGHALVPPPRLCGREDKMRVDRIAANWMPARDWLRWGSGWCFEAWTWGQCRWSSALSIIRRSAHFDVIFIFDFLFLYAGYSEHCGLVLQTNKNF